MGFDWIAIGENFILLLVAFGTLGLAYSANIAFSLFYNTKLIGEQYDKEKMKLGLLKIVVLLIGLLLLNFSILILIQLVGLIGIEVPPEYSDIISAMAVITTTMFGAAYYIKEAYEKYKMILSVKKP